MAEHRKVALITGAASPLGASFAEAFHRAGYGLVVHGFCNTEGLNSLVGRIVAAGGECHPVFSDFREPEAVTQLIDCVTENFGRLDLLINNASTFPDKHQRCSNHDLLSESVEDWEDSLAINARTPFFLMQAAYPLLSAAAAAVGTPAGCILNLLDQSISSPFLSRAAHSVSKAALAAATKVAAQTFRGRVRVFGIELPELDQALTAQVAALALGLAREN